MLAAAFRTSSPRGWPYLSFTSLNRCKIENDDAERQTVTARAVEFFFERLRKEASIVKAGQRIGDRIALKFLELAIFKNDGNANESRGGEHIHQNSFEGDRATELLGKVRGGV